MNWGVVLEIMRHEWIALTRRNLAGLLTGFFPVIATPIVGFMSASMVQTIMELRDYDVMWQDRHVIVGALAAMAFFPVMYAVFQTSDLVVLELELGTIELLLWAPVKELELLLGKMLLPLILNVIATALNFLSFGVFYSIGTRQFGIESSPWSAILSMLLVMLPVLALSVMMGILVSSHTTNTKAAATTSLSLGSLLMLAETALGVVLVISGIAVPVVLLILVGVNLVGACGSTYLITQRLGHREQFFLRGTKGTGK